MYRVPNTGSENAGENRYSKCQICGRILSRCESRLWEGYSFFKREVSAWIIIRVKSLWQDQLWEVNRKYRVF